MRKIGLSVALAALVIGSAAGAAPSKPNSASAKGEARLAKMLEGRVAGKPVSCIPARLDDRLRIIDQTAIVYDGGSTIYVSRPRDPRSLNTDDVLVINRFGSELCKQDIIRTVDRMSGFLTGVVFLGDFVPYTRPRQR